MEKTIQQLDQPESLAKIQWRELEQERLEYLLNEGLPLRVIMEQTGRSGKVVKTRIAKLLADKHSAGVDITPYFAQWPITLQEYDEFVLKEITKKKETIDPAKSALNWEEQDPILEKLLNEGVLLGDIANHLSRPIAAVNGRMHKLLELKLQAGEDISLYIGRWPIDRVKVNRILATRRRKKQNHGADQYRDSYQERISHLEQEVEQYRNRLVIVEQLLASLVTPEDEGAIKH